MNPRFPTRPYQQKKTSPLKKYIRPEAIPKEILEQVDMFPGKPLPPRTELHMSVPGLPLKPAQPFPTSEGLEATWRIIPVRLSGK